MTKKFIAFAVCAMLAASGVTYAGATSAQANGSGISNGDFETDQPGNTSATGWTSINDRIDLGVTSIAGCLTQDTSDYSTLRDWQVSYDGYFSNQLSSPTPEGNNDTYPLDDDVAFPPTYAVEVIDGNNLSGDFSTTTNVLGLYSLIDTFPYGYVIHGPAIYSDTFTAKTIDDLSIRWAAENISDDYHVFGYLLNVDTCAQQEVIDSNGLRTSGWLQEQVAVPSNGTYRFVFVAGTYDNSWGGVGGAFLYLDDIALTVNEERAAEEAAALGSPVIANSYRADKLETVYFAPLSSKLSKAAKKQIEAAIIANPSAVYKITGYVQKSIFAKNAKNDADLSLARAKAIETYLVSLGAGVTFTVVVDAGQVPTKNGTSNKARRATLYAMTPVVQ